MSSYYNPSYQAYEIDGGPSGTFWELYNERDEFLVQVHGGRDHLHDPQPGWLLMLPVSVTVHSLANWEANGCENCGTAGVAEHGDYECAQAREAVGS